MGKSGNWIQQWAGNEAEASIYNKIIIIYTQYLRFHQSLLRIWKLWDSVEWCQADMSSNPPTSA